MRKEVIGLGMKGMKMVSGALATAAGVARHVVWYVSYQMGRDRDRD